jgi:two-component sensor histidine kinase
LIALAKAHDILTKENWEGATLGDVVETAIAPHRSTEAERFIIGGPSILLPPKYTLALAMALHELCTNAMKYGALSNHGGRVEIVWDLSSREGASEFHIKWREIGGPPVVPPTRRGFGSRLIEQGLRQDLAGEVQMEFAPDGVICTIKAPLEHHGHTIELG